MDAGGVTVLVLKDEPDPQSDQPDPSDFDRIGGCEERKETECDLRYNKNIKMEKENSVEQNTLRDDSEIILDHFNYSFGMEDDIDVDETEFKHMVSIEEQDQNKKQRHTGVKYSCDQCDYKATRKDNLKRHTERHLGIAYPCDMCDHKATTEQGLKEHQKHKHEGVKHVCYACNYKASTKALLNTHVKSVHLGIRHHCSQCDFKTARSNKLKLHIQKVHEGVRHTGVKYSCDQCDYKATRKDNLKRHAERHLGIAYPCDMCDHKATTKSGLKEHQKYKHEDVKHDAMHVIIKHQQRHY